MEVILAKSAGFCFGVKRAVEQVYEQTKTDQPIYTFGPIIHNEEVVRDLEEKGVRVVEDMDEIGKLSEGTLIIRSHGVSEETYRRLSESGLKIVDATCPFVKRIHNIVAKESEAGAQIVIIGDEGHPEVEGIRGWSKTPAIVVGRREEAEKFTVESGKKVCIVSQTTYSYNKFQELVEIFSQKGYDITVVNTICNATEERQTEAAEIAGMVDAMIVIGGRTSSNSKKLYEICRQKCENTVFIQTVHDLHLDLKGNTRRVGITAGASTPNNIIEEVQDYVRINF
ncbi:MAG: 4-hydroxy-3-methylbut-2-enyl diphosphate reductase [Lachnospiraceae bacterium]